MSTVWKRFQRINKKAAKFQFTASFHELSLHLTPKWQPHSLEVVWQRRNRRVATEVPQWEPGMREPLEGVCVWTIPANTSVNVTLFRDNRTQRYEDKEWTFVLEDVSASGKRRQVALAQVNMTQYAGICQHDLRITLKPLSKKLVSATLELTLSCLFLREGKATDEDMQSLASLMSMSCPNDIAPLDDFEDDDEDGGGKCAEISDLAAQISSLTCSLQQGTPTDAIGSGLGFDDQEGDNATLEGDFVKECSALSPDPRSPQLTSPKLLSPETCGDATNTSAPPQDTNNTYYDERNNTSSSSNNSSTPIICVNTSTPIPINTGVGTISGRDAGASSPTAMVLSTTSDVAGGADDAADADHNNTWQSQESERRRTLQDRQALAPLDLNSSMVGRNSSSTAAATPGQDLITWCQQVVAGHKGVRITNMTTSWRNGLAFCAVIHTFRPDLIEYNKLSPQDVVGNCRAAFEAGEKLGIPRLIEPQDMQLRAVPDKLAVITYLYQLRAHFTGHELEVAQLGDTTAESSYTIGRLDASPPVTPATLQQLNSKNNKNNSDELSNKSSSSNADNNNESCGGVDATTAAYNTRNKRLSSSSAGDGQDDAGRGVRSGSESSQNSQKSNTASVTSAKDRLLASSKSITSEFLKLGSKVLSPTSSAAASKADNRKSTSSVGSTGSQHSNNSSGEARPALMTRRQLVDPFASDEEDEETSAREDSLNSNRPSAGNNILYQSGGGAGNAIAADNADDPREKRISLQDIDVPGLLDLSPISPTLSQQLRNSASNRYYTNSIRSAGHATSATGNTQNFSSTLNSTDIPTTFNTPPVTPLASDTQQQSTGAGNTVQSPQQLQSGQEVASAAFTSPSPTSAATPAAIADILRGASSPGHKKMADSQQSSKDQLSSEIKSLNEKDPIDKSAQKEDAKGKPEANVPCRTASQKATTSGQNASKVSTRKTSAPTNISERSSSKEKSVYGNTKEEPTRKPLPKVRKLSSAIVDTIRANPVKKIISSNKDSSESANSHPQKLSNRSTTSRKISCPILMETIVKGKEGSTENKTHSTTSVLSSKGSTVTKPRSNVPSATSLTSSEKKTTAENVRQSTYHKLKTDAKQVLQKKKNEVTAQLAKSEVVNRTASKKIKGGNDVNDVKKTHASDNASADISDQSQCSKSSPISIMVEDCSTKANVLSEAIQSENKSEIFVQEFTRTEQILPADDQIETDKHFSYEISNLVGNGKEVASHSVEVSNKLDSISNKEPDTSISQIMKTDEISVVRCQTVNDDLKTVVNHANVISKEETTTFSTIPETDSSETYFNQGTSVKPKVRKISNYPEESRERILETKYTESKTGMENDIRMKAFDLSCYENPNDNLDTYFVAESHQETGLDNVSKIVNPHLESVNNSDLIHCQSLDDNQLKGVPNNPSSNVHCIENTMGVPSQEKSIDGHESIDLLTLTASQYQHGEDKFFNECTTLPLVDLSTTPIGLGIVQQNENKTSTNVKTTCEYSSKTVMNERNRSAILKTVNEYNNPTPKSFDDPDNHFNKKYGSFSDEYEAFNEDNQAYIKEYEAYNEAIMQEALRLCADVDEAEEEACVWSLADVAGMDLVNEPADTMSAVHWLFSKARGSSRHEELKERARQLLEAARRDAAAAAAAAAADPSSPAAGTAAHLQHHAPNRSISKEEGERQAILRERARRLIAEAKQGVVSPPQHISPTRHPAGGLGQRQSSREVSADRSIDNGLIVIGGGNSSSHSGYATSPNNSRQSPLRIQDIGTYAAAAGVADASGSFVVGQQSSTESSKSHNISRNGSSESSRSGREASTGLTLREIRANKLQSFASIMDRLSPDKDAPKQSASEKVVTGREGSQYLAGELAALEREQEQIDAQASKLEKRLRRVMESGSAGREGEEERLMQRWFTLVNKKNALIRRQEQLNILEKESNLERRFELLNRELRAILTIEECQKTEVQQRQEALLLDELVQIVNMRNELVNHLDSQEKMLDDDQRIAHDVSRASVKATQEKCSLM